MIQKRKAAEAAASGEGDASESIDESQASQNPEDDELNEDEVRFFPIFFSKKKKKKKAGNDYQILIASFCR